MKYERLTTRNNLLGIVINKKAITLQGLLDSLAELEDKIERGELVEVPKGSVVLTPEERAEEMRLCNEERKQLDHRAEIAEWALLDMCRETAAFPSYLLACALMERRLKKAEKELAEERENAESRRKDN